MDRDIAILLGVVFLLIGISGAWHLTALLRYRKAERSAQACGPLLVYNEHKGVLAICRYVDFQSALASRKAVPVNLQKEENLQALFAPVRVEINPTFTFTRNEFRIPLHTGDLGDVERIKKTLIREVTGFRKDQLMSSDLIRHLLIEDKRLVVPFVGIKEVIDAHRQIAVFGGKTVEDAIRTLVPVR